MNFVPVLISVNRCHDEGHGPLVELGSTFGKVNKYTFLSGFCGSPWLARQAAL